jgi:ribosome biogenesis GTPase
MTLSDWGWTDFFANQSEIWANSKQIPAKVIRGEKNYFRVWTERGEMTVRFAGKIRHKADGRADFPVVGDWVAIEFQGNRGLIHAVCNRTSHFSRNLPGRRKAKGGFERSRQQVIAANVDLVCIVSGLDQDFNLRRIERYLTLVGNSGAKAVILLNKSDLCEDPQHCREQVLEIAGATPVHICSALNAAETEFILNYLHPGQTLAFLGSSGVGKSTLINALIGEDRQKIGAVSESDGKGRHTTTHRELILLPQGGILMDNPGMRELHLWGEQEDLRESFSDIDELAANCKFNDCSHKSEPQCAVKVAVEDGRLNGERLASYQKLKEELNNLEPYK